MSMKRSIAPGEYYHIFNRGAHRQGLFRERSDWARFLFEILYFQSPIQFKNVARIVRTFDAEVGFDISEHDFGNVLKARNVELVSYCLMSNHFHLMVRELADGGVSRYMQRIGDAYAKYFVSKYQLSGHLFESPYKAVHMEDNRQLLYTSAYIHQNPHEIKTWRGREEHYPWSSLYDYVTANRWGGLLAQEIILDQFEGSKSSNYADFVRTSTAKIFEKELVVPKKNPR